MNSTNQQATPQDIALLEKLQQEFMHMVAHRLRAPLTAIRGASEIINTSDIQTMDKQDLTKLLNIINYEAKQALEQLSLVVDAVDSSEKLSINKKSADINKLIRERVSYFSEKVKTKGVTITTMLPDTFPQISFDPLRITQLVDNLIINSIKATSQGGHIEISVLTEGNKLILKVSDNGVGISNENQRLLFQDPTQSLLSSQREEGLIEKHPVHLGLFLSKKILDLHGGSISISSVVNKGTTVTCYIPIEEGLLPAPHDMLLNSKVS